MAIWETVAELAGLFAKNATSFGGKQSQKNWRANSVSDESLTKRSGSHPAGGS
jgi:hypothetical protein